MIEIKAGPITLRRHAPDDLGFIHRWQNDSELLFLNSDTESDWTREDTQRHLERWMASHDAQSQSLYFGICAGPTSLLVGFAALALIELQHERCRLAITIDQKHWGLGYGRHAVSGLVAFAFDHLMLHRVMAEIYDFNERAIRLMQSVGFRKEGTLRAHVWKRGWRDELIFGLLRPEFVEGRTALPTADVSVTGFWESLVAQRAERSRQ